MEFELQLKLDYSATPLSGSSQGFKLGEIWKSLFQL